MHNDEYWMALAIEEAHLAEAEGELPVGCVIAKDGRLIARARNARERTGDPTAHAEILALRAAGEALKSWHLTGCTLYVTLEPCPMCAGAIEQARISRLVYGAPDPAQGCAGSVYRLTEDPAFNWFCPADGGILSAECAEPLGRFFRSKR